MSLNLKNLSVIQVKENFNGKNDNFLIIKCSNCSEPFKNLYKNNRCFKCLLENLNHNKNQKFKYISIESYEKLIEEEQFTMFLEYFRKLRKIEKILQIIENLRINKCKYKNFRCRILPKSSSFFSFEREKLFDPVLFYNNIKGILRSIGNSTIIDTICLNCIDELEKYLNNLKDLLENLKIIKNIKDFNRILRAPYDYYKSLFSIHDFLSIDPKTIKKSNKESNLQLFEEYNIGNNALFNVKIYKIPDEAENSYDVKLSFKSKIEEEYFETLVQDLVNNIDNLILEKVIPLEKLIQLYKNEVKKVIDTKYSFSEEKKNRISFYTALKKLNLEKIFPLLIDDFVEEIFLDSPNEELYLNHQKFGRCRTNAFFSTEDINRIKTLLRLYSGQRLDYSNPSIKFVMKNKFFYCRFAIDIAPINVKSFALDIRKLNKNILTVQDLLQNHTLTPLMAAFLYFNILRRKNITAIGETDTGKTTLINALDLLTPKEFRKIYIENILESVNQTIYNKHQLKFKVNSLDEADNIISKSTQIKTLLHRTPDLIYLGEILTENEAQAMFHCLAAGLRGFQTIHAKNLDALINRFLFHFNIDKSCLNDLDLIVLLKKDFNKRTIISISEIDINNLKTNHFYKSIFQYHPKSNKCKLLSSLYETNVIQEIITYENLSEESFNTIIKKYEDIFNYIMGIKRLTNIELIELFHKISFYSKKSLKSLNEFWALWKKTRSLN